MKSREWNYSGTIEKKISIREQVHHILARKVAEEAVVLLKNEAVLPLPVDCLLYTSPSPRDRG